MQATVPQRLYEVISERALREDELPSGEALDEVEATLSAVCEFLVDNVARSVIHVADAGEPNSITFEDIGRLLTWADSIRDRAEDIIEGAAKVAIVAHGAFDIASGYRGSGTIFSEHGTVQDESRYAELKRKYGFDEASRV